MATRSAQIRMAYIFGLGNGKCLYYSKLYGSRDP